MEHHAFVQILQKEQRSQIASMCAGAVVYEEYAENAGKVKYYSKVSFGGG